MKFQEMSHQGKLVQHLKTEHVERIEDMSYDMLSQIVDEIKSYPSCLFSIQLDKLVDVASIAQFSFSFTSGMLTGTI